MSCQNPNALQEGLGYTWGADGRLANFSITSYCCTPTSPPTTTTMSAHWDGDDLLYVSGLPSGGVSGLTLYVEKLGVIAWQSNVATNGIAVYDRDQTGTAIDEHWGSTPSAAFFSALSVDNIHPFRLNCSPISPVTGQGTGTCQPSGNAISASVGGPSDPIGADDNENPPKLLLDATREDGYFDGTLSIQGVRAYDPVMNQWTTPDAYSGDVHDPMSQHPYMWNGNNPMQYDDPSGYTSTVTDEGHGNLAIDIKIKFSGDTTSSAGKKAEEAFIKGLEAYGGQHGTYNVTVNVTVMSDSAKGSDVNSINIVDGDAPSKDNNGTNFWMIGTSDDYNSWGDTHEAGHVIGLPDAYGQSWSDQWDGNIMKQQKGSVDSRDITYLQRALGGKASATLSAATACTACMQNPGDPQ